MDMPENVQEAIIRASIALEKIAETLEKTEKRSQEVHRLWALAESRHEGLAQVTRAIREAERDYYKRGEDESDADEFIYPFDDDQNALTDTEILRLPMRLLRISTRITNTVKWQLEHLLKIKKDAYTLGDVVKLTKEDLITCGNFGWKSLRLLQAELGKYGLILPKRR